MTYLVVRHKVKSYAKWKPMFDEHAKTRAAGGGKGGWLLRSVDHPNEIMIAFAWSSAAKAKKFIKSADLKKVMKEAGVIDKPDVWVLEEVERFAK